MLPDRFERLSAALRRRQPDLTVLMERVHKSHNLSAILRNCDAVGVLEAHAVPPEEGLDISHHTSAGTAKWVRVVRHATVDSAVGALHEDGFRVVAAHPSPEAVDYREVDFTAPTAIMVGAELHGLSERGLELADRLVGIPMAGMAHSLNVSVATALLLFEAFRQRHAAGLYDHSRLDEGEFRTLLFEWAYPRLARRYREQGRPYPELGLGGELPSGGR
jgi:tRNA (guanosine-2'-O-)-methyltransferase